MFQKLVDFAQEYGVDLRTTAKEALVQELSDLNPEMLRGFRDAIDELLQKEE